MSATSDRVEIVAQTISGGSRKGPTQADYNFAEEIVRRLDAYDRTTGSRWVVTPAQHEQEQ